MGNCHHFTTALFLVTTGEYSHASGDHRPHFYAGGKKAVVLAEMTATGARPAPARLKPVKASRSLPVIDIGPLRRGTQLDRARVADELG